MTSQQTRLTTQPLRLSVLLVATAAILLRTAGVGHEGGTASRAMS
ncbi:MAG: hypothetical protein BWZ02_00098 [Lentisphaerae bacterium ADurb.BinA184]|nr:MAG: hypothetical protein BWZ02_00098 [Lentisphaerae bacterium ADurb.BinA184]